ncbi:MAG: nucleotidyltransferase domain-containing protein [Dehalococcoidia bacterium]|nr:nucleotidyltransferase domain-containing protein [Dehalococcoidia bacterium]
MRPHHEKAIQKLVEHFSNDETCLAIIVGGSVAKGLAQEGSDVDVMLVVTDEVFREKWEQNKLVYFSQEFCDHPGCYIDGKIVNLDYLRAVAERGNEVTRAAFDGAFIAHSKIDGLDEIMSRIPIYQMDQRQEKIQAFYAQFEIAHWLVGEAEKRDDRYLLDRAVSDLILYGGRLILAHNCVLYPYHKLFMVALWNAPEKPDNLMALVDALLKEHTAENARAFYEAVKNFRFWNEAWELPALRFMKDTELAWLENRAYIGDI